MRIFLASAAGRTASSAAPITATRSTGRTSSLRPPVMMRETSRMSPTSRACRGAFRSMTLSARAQKNNYLAVGSRRDLGDGAATQRSRRPPEQPLEDFVEATDAAKTRGQRHFCHR